MVMENKLYIDSSYLIQLIRYYSALSSASAGGRIALIADMFSAGVINNDEALRLLGIK